MESRFALVTGGSRGIGRAISLQLAQDGYNVIVNYRANEEAAQELLIELNAIGGSHSLLRFDVSNQAQTIEALNQWTSDHPEAEIYALVNNSGIRRDHLLIAMPDEDWTDVLQTNLHSFFYITKYICNLMARKRRGRIVNMVSLSGLKGLPGQTNYSASKAGLIGATKALSLEVAKRNITVNAVAPGFIRTDMTADLDENELKAMVPMNRFGLPEEVADLVSFLVSDKASYITGQVVSINGGLY